MSRSGGRRGGRSAIYTTALFTEGGASFAAGPNDRLRFGKGVLLAADVKWTHAFGDWHTEVEFQAPVVTGAALKVELGRAC